MKSASAVSGVATVEGEFTGGILFTIVPTSASGTGTITVKPPQTTDAPTGYEAAYDADGAALTVDLSAQSTHRIDARLLGVKVTSDNAADTFELVVG
jgi:hypothetical protein